MIGIKNLLLKFVIFPVILLLLVFLVINKKNCSTLELRQQYLNGLVNLSDVNIDTEIKIDGYIISGYTSANSIYGVAIFAPVYGGNYKFQSNINKDYSEILVSAIVIRGVNYNLFWANRENLDYAQITYSTSDGTEKYRLDISANEIVYMQAPDKYYEVSAIFVTTDGKRYQ